MFLFIKDNFSILECVDRLDFIPFASFTTSFAMGKLLDFDGGGFFKLERGADALRLRWLADDVDNSPLEYPLTVVILPDLANGVFSRFISSSSIVSLLTGLFLTSLSCRGDIVAGMPAGMLERRFFVPMLLVKRADVGFLIFDSKPRLGVTLVSLLDDNDFDDEVE